MLPAPQSSAWFQYSAQSCRHTLANAARYHKSCGTGGGLPEYRESRSVESWDVGVGGSVEESFSFVIGVEDVERRR